MLGMNHEKNVIYSAIKLRKRNLSALKRKNKSNFPVEMWALTNIIAHIVKV